jgi:hypothetical protein
VAGFDYKHQSVDGLVEVQVENMVEVKLGRLAIVFEKRLEYQLSQNPLDLS